MYVWVCVLAGVGNKAANRGLIYLRYFLFVIINKADFPMFNFFLLGLFYRVLIFFFYPILIFIVKNLLTSMRDLLRFSM